MSTNGEDRPPTTDEDKAASNAAGFAKQITGLRAFLTANKGRQDEPVGAVQRLVYDHLRRHKIPSSGSTLKTRQAIEKLSTKLELSDDELSEEDEKALADCHFALDNWKIVEDEYRRERESARAIAGQEGMHLLTRAESPTAEFPVPIAQCVIDGCRRNAVLGATRCENHGGNWLDPQVRQALLLNAYEGLVKASDRAVATLVDVMDNSPRDDARVAAAREVLDRAGIRTGVDVNIIVTPDVQAKDTLDKIRKRLDEMGENINAATASLLNDNVVDAEIVSDDDGTESG